MSVYVDPNAVYTNSVGRVNTPQIRTPQQFIDYQTERGVIRDPDTFGEPRLGETDLRLIDDLEERLQENLPFILVGIVALLVMILSVNAFVRG